MAEDFSKYSHGTLKGCVTAIDGWVAKTRKPNRDEVVDIMAYRNRDGCWGLVVLAGCDAHCRFTMFSCKNSGATNDSIAWDMSNLKMLIPVEFYIIGKWTLILTVCAKLHNYCLDANIPIAENRFYRDREEDDVFEVMMNNNDPQDVDEMHRPAQYARRTRFTAILRCVYRVWLWL